MLWRNAHITHTVVEQILVCSINAQLHIILLFHIFFTNIIAQRYFYHHCRSHEITIKLYCNVNTWTWTQFKKTMFHAKYGICKRKICAQNQNKHNHNRFPHPFSRNDRHQLECSKTQYIIITLMLPQKHAIYQLQVIHGTCIMTSKQLWAIKIIYICNVPIFGNRIPIDRLAVI